MKKVIIIGASGHAKVIADIVIKSGDKLVGFLDDNIQLPEKVIGYPYLGVISDYATLTYSIYSDSISFNNISGKRRDKISGNIDIAFRFFLNQINLSNNTINKLLYQKSYRGKIRFVRDEIKKVLSSAKKNFSFIKYDHISQKIRNKLLGSLSIKCCPYCNRQYITSWFDNNSKVHSTADLDHYYPKSIFPLFALSLFNFVPSCQICNSRMKLDSVLETLYPYEDEMDAFDFRCVSKNNTPESLVNLWISESTFNIEKLLEKYELILMDCSEDISDTKVISHIEKIKNSIEVFHLNEVYKNHIDTALDEILKIRVYLSGDYKKYGKSILNEIGITDEINRFSEPEMKDIILGFITNGQDILDQPLGKMKKDIFDYEMKLKASFAR